MLDHSERVGSAYFYIEREVLKLPLHAMHSHSSYELYYMVKGEREYFIGDRFFKITAGDLVLIPGKILHRTAGEGGLRYLVHFSRGFVEKFFTAAALEPLLKDQAIVFRGEAREVNQIQAILNLMLSEFVQAERERIPQNEALHAGYLYQLLFLVAYSNNIYVPYDYADERITKIIQYINENYSQINDIDEIAEQFFISKFYLCRFFKKKLGISLVSYLNKIKIREACQMIRNGENNLTEIALKCGFNSSSYFCKVFKVEKGISPTEYRKRHR
ncbi:MAG: helix-turn-helix transcriptional regulator [Oscillospiraceae bacterium]|nr:helix-turn-helix transcriptional regulator [Oscillospiraceae bacterium]